MSYYDKKGQPITGAEWMRLMEDVDYRRVALSDIPHGSVSTVWLGLDHRMLEEDGPSPLIFETMAFPSERYIRTSTLELAQAAHAMMVARETEGVS